MGKAPTEPHLVVSDESGVDGSNQYQSVAFVSGPASEMTRFNRLCKEVIAKHGATELKWERIASGEKNRASHELLEEFMLRCSLRVLVLSWNMADSRHAIERRDDTANFHRMLFHGLRRNADWQSIREWDWYPDQRTDLDHEQVREYVNLCREGKTYPTKPNRLFEIHRESLLIRKAEPKCSKEVPIIGMADLFAGAIRTSRYEGANMIRLINERLELNTGLFEEFEDPGCDLSRALRARAAFGARLHHLGQMGKQGISLRGQGYFTTPRPGQGRFLFSHWQPQGEHDKAPTKPKLEFL